MKKVEHYICEVCNTEYAEKTKCERCEKSHRKPMGIASARYVPVTQSGDGFPASIEVEFVGDGGMETITYKRCSKWKGEAG